MGNRCLCFKKNEDKRGVKRQDSKDLNKSKDKSKSAMSKSMSSQIGSDVPDDHTIHFNKDSYCTTNEQGLIRPNIDLFDINNPRLQYIFNKETDELEKSFAAFKKTIGEEAKGIKTYKLEVMICLWFCIHKESL